MSAADWIAVDWGTSQLRAWLMRADGRMIERRVSDAGMATLDRGDFAPALQRLVGDAMPAPVIACGMVGARQGWVEAPYASVPCAPPGAAQARRVPGEDVHVLRGVRQDNPADVMRGEETQVAGFLHNSPGFDGVLCLPGTHTKWVHVSAGEIVSFRTAMTGELFALLTDRSVLRHSVSAGWDSEAFAVGVDQTLSRPETLASSLFSIRAEGLLQDLGGAAARARVSGLLIGAELAAMRPYWLGQPVAVIGADALRRAYVAALTAQAVPVQEADGDEMTLAGLTAAFADLQGVAT
ncbi:MAG: 2-dehydro-3-deoxygalactonokinase [Pseudomonadota bacterium]